MWMPPSLKWGNVFPRGEKKSAWHICLRRCVQILVLFINYLVFVYNITSPLTLSGKRIIYHDWDEESISRLELRCFGLWNEEKSVVNFRAFLIVFLVDIHCLGYLFHFFFNFWFIYALLLRFPLYTNKISHCLNT